MSKIQPSQFCVAKLVFRLCPPHFFLSVRLGEWEGPPKGLFWKSGRREAKVLVFPVSSWSCQQAFSSGSLSWQRHVHVGTKFIFFPSALITSPIKSTSPVILPPQGSQKCSLLLPPGVLPPTGSNPTSVPTESLLQALTSL